MTLTKRDIADIMEDIFALEIDFDSARKLVSKDCQWLRDKAHNEYAQRSTDEEDNALANFERLSKKLDNQVSREQVLWVYTTKHLDGIQAYVNGHRSQREGIEGRINDAITYLILLRGMVEDDRLNRQREVSSSG